MHKHASIETTRYFLKQLANSSSMHLIETQYCIKDEKICLHFPKSEV